MLAMPDVMIDMISHGRIDGSCMRYHIGRASPTSSQPAYHRPVDVERTRERMFAARLTVSVTRLSFSEPAQPAQILHESNSPAVGAVAIHNYSWSVVAGECAARRRHVAFIFPSAVAVAVAVSSSAQSVRHRSRLRPAADRIRCINLWNTQLVLLLVCRCSQFLRNSPTRYLTTAFFVVRALQSNEIPSGQETRQTSQPSPPRTTDACEFL